MKFKMIAVMMSVLFFTAASYSVDNSCAYTFTYVKPQFSFCVTIWGTLASIQSPIGVNHLDPVNPVEGWSASIRDADGGTDGFNLIPGLGAVDFTYPPTVRQPHGPGTLPLIFNYGSGDAFETVYAVPSEREIFMILSIRANIRDF